MKKNCSFVFICMFVLVASYLSSCQKIIEMDCHERGKLYCPDKGGACCDSYMPYSDGNMCHSSFYGCRQTGKTCTECK